MTHKLPDSHIDRRKTRSVFGRVSLALAIAGSLMVAAIFAEAASINLFDHSIFGLASAAPNTSIAAADDLSKKKSKSDGDAQRTEVSQYFQGFETDNTWGNPPTDPTRVASGTNGITSKTGGYHAEAISNNFTRWGGYNSIFPTLGYTTSVDVYLNTTGGYSNDTRFAFMSAINKPDGTHRRDFVFSCGFYNDGVAPGTGNRFVCSASNNAPGWPKDPGRQPTVITTSPGWFTLKHYFYNNGGVLAVDMSILDSTGGVIKTWTLSDPSDIIGSSVGGNRYGWFFPPSPQPAFPFLAIDNARRSNVVAANVETVTSADLTAAKNTTDWFFWDDNLDVINNTLGSFVSGPGSAPAGAGSIQMSVSGSERKNIATDQFAGTPLASINELKFSLYNPSAGNGGSPTTSGYLHFNVDFNGSNTWQRRLVFVPEDNGTITQDTWKEWDAIKNGTALWEYSGLNWPAGIGGGGEPGATTKSWSQILSQYPGVKMLASDSWLGIRVGNPDAFGYTENIDKFVFGTTSNTTIFDFEPLPIMVDDDGAASSTDCDAADPAFTTIQAGVNAATAGATVKVCPGNYTEDVAINGPTKAGIKLIGSGVDISTITGPHATGVGDTVQIISAPGVTIDGFTITRTGNNTIDWGGNTQNQGISLGGSPNVTIQNSKFTGNRNAILVEQSSNNVTIRRNIVDFNRTGIHLVDNSNALIEENYITNNWTTGILYRCSICSPSNPAPMTVRNNNISGNWYSNIEFREPAGASILNMGGNYLGTTNPTRVITTSGEPGYAVQIPVAYGGSSVPPGTQTGTIAGPESARVDYSPFLNSGTDTQPATPGFQGNPANVTVNADSAQTNVGYNNIQEAINSLPTGGTVTALSGTYAGNVDVNKAMTLLGTPTISGTLSTSSPGATIAPGFSPGIINSGSITLVPSSTVNIELNGTTPGTYHDQLNVTGTVNLGGATLNVTTGYSVQNGDSYVIVNNDLADAVTGTFAGLPEGATFIVSGTTFQISYVGGTGNDVVLTATAVSCNQVSTPVLTSLPNVPISIPVNIDDTTGRGIIGLDVTLTYETDTLNPAGITATLGPVASGAGYNINTSTAGTIVISIFSSTPFSGAGTLINLNFLNTGGIGESTPLTLSGLVLNGTLVCGTTSSGSLTIVSGNMTGKVTYENHAPGYPVPNVNLNAPGPPAVAGLTDVNGDYTLSGFGAGSQTVTPSKAPMNWLTPNGIFSNDASDISKYVVGLIPLNPVQLRAAKVSGNATPFLSSFDAALIAQWIVGIPNPINKTGTWTFTNTSNTYPNVNVNITGQDYLALLLGDVTGDWVTGPLARPAARGMMPSENAVRASVDASEAEKGSIVNIPFKIENLKGAPVTSYQFDIEYDPNVLEADRVAATVEETVSSGLSVVSNAPKPGLLKVVVFGALPVTSDGVYVNLKFAAIGEIGSRSPINIRGFRFNDGSAETTTADSEVVVTAAKNIGIKGRLLTAMGEPVAADVTLSAFGKRGVVGTTRSGADGRFEFGGLDVGRTYTIKVRSKEYRFEPVIVSYADNAVNLDLIALP